MIDDNDVKSATLDYKFIFIIQEGLLEDPDEDIDKAQAQKVEESFIIINGMDHLGKLTVLFTQEMNVPRDLTAIDHTVLEIEIYSVEEDFSYRR